MSDLLPLNCEYVLNTHQLNILAALEHRIKVAKSESNVSLVDLLEIEKQGINPISIQFNSSRRYSSQKKSPFAWLKRLTHSFIDNFVPKSELQVKHLCDATGNEWWYAYDPKTGESVYASSDSEMRLWIDSYDQEL